MYKQVAGTILIFVIFMGLFMAGRMTAPDHYPADTDTLYMPVDSADIIQDARIGYIRGTYSGLKKRFGKIYVDTSICWVDSLNIKDSVRYKDSIITVIKMESDTIFNFWMSDTISGVSAGFNLALKTSAYLHPVYKIQNRPKVYNFRFTGIPRGYDWKWYDNFYVGVGFPGWVNAGYCMTAGDIRRMRK